MRVRVYDKKTNTYFKSEVYAIINSRYYEKVLVLTPEYMGNCLRLYDYLDKADNELPVLINSITIERPCEWIYMKSHSVNEQLVRYKGLLESDIKFFEYSGFSWLWNDTDSLIKLLHGESISLRGSIFEKNIYSNMKQTEWKYIETEDDVNLFMKQTYSFHDSIIKEVNYVSGNFVDSDKIMNATNLRKVVLRVDSQQCSNIEMIFEGVTALNLRPPLDNYFGDIYEASIIVKDASVFFL